MKIKIVPQLRNECEADIEIICVIKKDLGHRWIEDKETLQLLGFEGGQDQTCLLAQSKRIYVGSDSINHDNIRSAYAAAIKALRNTKVENVKTALYLGENLTQNLQAMVEGMILGDYEFDTYKTEKAKHPVKNVTIAAEDFNGKDIDIEQAKRAVEDAIKVAEATNFTR